MKDSDYNKEAYLTLSDGREAMATYFVDDYGSEPSGMCGPPEDYDPGSGALICVGSVFVDEVKIEVRDEERERIEEKIAANPDWWMPSESDYDYDD